MTCQQWLERQILEAAIRAGFGDQSLSKLLRALAMNIDGRAAVKQAEEHLMKYGKDGMYLVWSELKNGKIARHYLMNTLALAKERMKTVSLKYPGRVVGYKLLRKVI